MNPVAYLFLRLAIGLSMFLHGFVRIPQLKDFSDGMVEDFEASMLPEFIVKPYSFALPFLELIIGFFVILGYKSAWFSVAGAAFMLTLIFGASMAENWSALPSQLIHTGFFVLLIQFMPANTFSLDAYLSKRQP